MQQAVRHLLYKLKYIIAFVIFGVIITFLGETSLINRLEQQKEIAHLKSEIDQYNRKFAKDKQLLNNLKSDQDALKEVARERYYMKTEDEDIFLIEDED